MYLGKAQFQRCEGAVVKRVTHELMAVAEGYCHKPFLDAIYVNHQANSWAACYA